MTTNTIIKICEVIGTILTIIGGIMFSTDNHKIPGIWIIFSGIVIILFGLALYLQYEVSKVKVASPEKLKNTSTTVSRDSLNKINSFFPLTEDTKLSTNKKHNLTQEYLRDSEKPVLDISNAIITTIINSEVTVFITLTNLGKTTATDVKVYSNAILSPVQNWKDFTTPYKNENILSDIPAGVGKTMYHTSYFNPVPLNTVIQEKRMYLYIYGKIVYGYEINKKTYSKHFSFFYNPDFKKFIDIIDGKYPPDSSKVIE